MGFCVVKLPEAVDGPASGNDAVTHLNGKEVSAMPWGDGTGPLGLGPMTGRAAGFCAGYAVPGYMNPAVGPVAWSQGTYPVGTPAYGYPGLTGGPWPYPAYAGAFGHVWGRPFGRGIGRGFGRGWGFGRRRSFGRGFARGRWW